MQLATFFKLVFTPYREGYVCVASRPANEKKGWREAYFYWPKESANMIQHIDEHSFTHDLWFCPQLLDTKKRDRSAVGFTPTVWADLDTCDPSVLKVQPTVIVESSPDRFQAYWLLDDEFVDPFDAEDAARRIAYFHKDDGADISGWDLSQILRIPTTKNFKYEDAPTVEIINFRNETIPLSELTDVYPEVDSIAHIMNEPMPTQARAATDILLSHRVTLNPLASIIFAQESKKEDQKRSTDLWKLECLLFEGGLTSEEVYWVVKEADCNKYEEDNRDPALLWRDVLRAKQYLTLDAQDQTFENDSMLEPLLTEVERQNALRDTTIIEEYTEWACMVTDAAEQYHPMCIMMVMSSLFAGRLTISTQFGKINTNLWCMLLADTTRTRKTTAMELALDILYDIDDNALLANEGSVEGVLDAVAARPGRTSLFYRDEFLGLLKAMSTKEYLSGMPEAFTKMYDGKQMKRILRKQTIDIRNPVFIMFTGGTKTSILQYLTVEQVESGFLPRFIFVTADSKNMPPERPLGPPTSMSSTDRSRIVAKLTKLFKHYTEATTIITINGKNPKSIPKDWEADLTPEAWAKFNEYAAIMSKFATFREDSPILMPCMNRLAMSGLKTAVLIAASRKQHQNKVEVTVDDIIKAFFYVEQWRNYLLEVIENLGKSQFERLVTGIVDTAYRERGILRGTIMRRYKLNAKQADDAISTAEQRMLISTKRQGKHIALFPFDEIG